MNTDELLTRLLDAVHTAATDSAKPGHGEIAADLEARLRAELAALAPLAEAAVTCVDATAGAALWHKDDPFGPVMREAVRYVGKLRGIETEGRDARAQAQAGEGA